MKLRNWMPVVVLALAGCANPADNVVEARVAEGAATETAAAEIATAPAATVYTLAEGTKVEFVGSKVTGKHDGGFRVVNGTISAPGTDPAEAKVSIEIDLHSIWADNEKLTGHLKSADFFDVEKYPVARFESTSIERAGDHYLVTGNLDLHGVTKQISFPATIEVNGNEAKADAEFFIKRFDFGIQYPGKTNDLIRDEVVIKLGVRAKRGEEAAAQPAA